MLCARSSRSAVLLRSSPPAAAARGRAQPGHAYRTRSRTGSAARGQPAPPPPAAEDVELGRPVGVKVLAENLAHDGAVRERLLREARIAARLSHPNVVRIYDTGEEGGRPYIVMELVDGESLAELVHREGPLAPEQ